MGKGNRRTKARVVGLSALEKTEEDKRERENEEEEAVFFRQEGRRR